MKSGINYNATRKRQRGVRQPKQLASVWRVVCRVCERGGMTLYRDGDAYVCAACRGKEMERDG